MTDGTPAPRDDATDERVQYCTASGYEFGGTAEDCGHPLPCPFHDAT